MTAVPWLTLLWSVPLAGAGLVLVPPRTGPAVPKWVGLAVTLATLAITVPLVLAFDPGGERYQFVESRPWIPSFGTGYVIGIDGTALALVALTAVLMPVLIITGWNDSGGQQRATNAYIALLLTAESMVLLSFLALDVLLFYVVFEATLIPLYFLIGRFGGAGRSRAALKFLLYNLFGGLVMLVAVIGLYVVSAGVGTATMDLRRLGSVAAEASPTVSHFIFAGFMVAFAIKAPLVPLHTWLPGVATSAKPVTAVLMMAVVDKLGTFGMLRYCLQLFPDSSVRFQPLFVSLAVISVVFAALVAIGQTDLMRLIAYASISHFGFIVLGIFVMTAQGQSGATLYMVNHGISTAALFLIAGFLVSRTGTRVIHAYGGVQKVAPVLAGSFLIAGLSALALPGLAPFVSEFLVLLGTFGRYPVAAVAASSALVLSALYILWAYQRIMTGPVAGATATNDGGLLRDLLPRERAAVAVLIALLLVLGAYPKPALDLINPAVQHTLSIFEKTDPASRLAEGPAS